MRLENTAHETAPTRRISVGDGDGGVAGFVEFDEDGKARTTAELGDALAEQVEHIEITDRETSASESADDTVSDEGNGDTEDTEE